jgi:multiple sugar transport system substrate-binding protein
VTLPEEDYYGPPGTAAADYQGNVFQKFFASYSAKNPCIQITRQAPVVGGSDAVYLTHVLSQFSSGSQPGLLMLDNPELAEFAADNVLVPLKSLGSLPVLSQLNPANVAETTYNGQLYALPLYTNTIAIFYNKTLVQQAGITTLPTTWAEFAADAKKTAHGSDLGFVFSGQAGPGEATWQFDPWAWSNGGSMLNPAGTASVQALNYLTSLVKEGAAPASVVNWSQQQPMQEFEAGKAAFVENGLWNIPGLDQDFPKLKWGVIQIPTQSAGQTVIAPFGGEVWAVPKTNPAEEAAAFKVLNAMAGNLKTFAADVGDVPTEPSLWNSAPWNTAAYAPFIAELKNGRSRTVGITNPSNEPAIDLDIGNAIEAALIGKQTPAQALTAAQAQVTPLIK